MLRSTRPAVFAAALLVSFVAPLRAQVTTVSTTGRAPAPTVRAHEVKTPPVIDGKMDDAAWKEAEVITGFTQREPRFGEGATERTEVRILTDGQALYVGAWLYDRSAADIVPGEKIRDVQLDNSDYFSFILDTFHDRQNGFVFATTPAGVEYDGQVTREGEGGGVFQQGQTRAQTGAIGGFNLNWDGSWTVATSRDSLGWYAEFRIPFTTIRYGGGGEQAWGLNIERNIRRKNEDVFWSTIPRQFTIYRLSLGGTLEGIRVPERKIATLTPYVIAATQRTFPAPATPPLPATTEYRRNVGADAKYGLTPSLTLDLTWNTDFAQVEVDDQRVNLTRFPLFFPEKRPFFLENAGIFTAGTPQLVDLFFTRRIGIDTAGNTVPIVGGGRVTGRVGSTTVGLLDMETNRLATQDGQSYSVGRVLREFGRRSRIGLIAVQRMSRDSSSNLNRTYGVDGRVGIGDEYTIDWWAARTESPKLGHDDGAYSARGVYSTQNWNINGRYVQTGSDFNPEMGFLNRSGGYRYYEVQLQRYLRYPSIPWLRDYDPHVTYRGFYGLDGFRTSDWMHYDVAEWDLNDGGKFGPELNRYHEGLKAPFEISKGVILPVGAYDFSTWGFDWTSNPSAPLNIILRGDVGAFYNGTRNSWTATVVGRRGAQWSSSVNVDYNQVHLAQGDFTHTVVGARLAWFFTPRISLQTLTQFNTDARVWTSNTRFSWLSTAGTGLYVVLNDGEEADGFFNWRRPQARTLTLKFSRQLGSGE